MTNESNVRSSRVVVAQAAVACRRQKAPPNAHAPCPMPPVSEPLLHFPSCVRQALQRAGSLTSFHRSKMENVARRSFSHKTWAS